jgi:hypothetical protein
MSIIDNNWINIDKNTEEKYYNNIRYVKPTTSKILDIDCSFCKRLVSSIEDVEAMKEANICEVCYLNYYSHNKEEWKKGWRPNIEL